jgi:hypothetical protein
MKAFFSTRLTPPLVNAPSADLPAPPLAPLRFNYPGLSSTDRAPREEIQHRAYAIWQSEGEPNDRALAHWLQAEAEVMQRN